MGVGSAARLHCCHLLWILDVGNVEDSYAAETVLLRYWDAVLFFFIFIFIFFFVASVSGVFIFIFFCVASVSGVCIFILDFVFILVGGRSRFRWESLNATIQTSIRHFY